jgi:hypothetical protein
MSETENDRLETIIETVKGGEGLSHEDATYLLDFANAVRHRSDASTAMLNVVAEVIPEMAASLAGSVMARCGRTEVKVKRSVEKICLQHIEAMRELIAGAAMTIANVLAAEDEVSEEAEVAQ